MVTIIGWDDTYSRWNFATELYDEDGDKLSYDPEIAEVVADADGVLWIVPLIDGAWIIKNSWGEAAEGSSGATMAMGDGGLFRFSYCEKTLAQPAVMVPDEAPRRPACLRRNVPVRRHQWPSSFGSLACRCTGANVFTASDNQTLDAVGVWVPDDDVEVYASTCALV